MTFVPPPQDASDGPVEAPGCAFLTPGDVRRRRRANGALFLAALAYVGAAAAIRFRTSLPSFLPALAVALTIVFYALAARSFAAYLRGLDELFRRLQTEALAAGFGAGLLFVLLYPLCEHLGAPHLEREATAIVMLAGAALGFWLGKRRYLGTGAA